MGCDIHLRLEKRLKKDKPYYTYVTNSDKEGNISSKEYVNYYTDTLRKWQNCYIFSHDNTWGDRIYGMFALLGDVRNYWDLKPIEQRGFPDDACNTTLDLYTYKEWKGSGEIPDYGHYADKETIDRWLKDGYKYIDLKDKKGEVSERRVIDPDAHSPNWCTTEEMEYCIDQIFKNKDGHYENEAEEWLALLGTMKGYEASGYYECRAVFWFDN